MFPNIKLSNVQQGIGPSQVIKEKPNLGKKNCADELKVNVFESILTLFP